MIFDLPTWMELTPRIRARKNVFPFDLYRIWVSLLHSSMILRVGSGCLAVWTVICVLPSRSRMVLDSPVCVPPRGARLRRIQMIDDEHGELPLAPRPESADRNEFEAAAAERARGRGCVHRAHSHG